MTRATHIKVHGWMTCFAYAFITYVLSRHIGWLDAFGAMVAMNVVVGAIRTKTTWDDLMTTMPPSSTGDHDP